LALCLLALWTILALDYFDPCLFLTLWAVVLGPRLGPFPFEPFALLFGPRCSALLALVTFDPWPFWSFVPWSFLVLGPIVPLAISAIEPSLALDPSGPWFYWLFWPLTYFVPFSPCSFAILALCPFWPLARGGWSIWPFWLLWPLTVLFF